MQELTVSLGIQGLSYGEHERLTTSLIKNTMEMKIFFREESTNLYFAQVIFKFKIVGFILLDFMHNHQSIQVIYIYLNVLLEVTWFRE